MKVPEVLLRAASADDSAVVAALHTSSWRDAYRALLPAQYLGERVSLDHRTHWDALLSRPPKERGLVLIAEIDQKPAGFVSAEKAANPAYGALLSSLHVMDAFQGRGLGRLMIEAVRAWAREQGETKVHLYALEGNHKAIRFYESNGWKFAGLESSRIGETPVTDRRYVIEA
nr:GNAT family N-acetyltransferase [Bordetella sp. FB-8]